jgi:hypothetical protein
MISRRDIGILKAQLRFPRAISATPGSAGANRLDPEMAEKCLHQQCHHETMLRPVLD